MSNEGEALGQATVALVQASGRHRFTAGGFGRVMLWSIAEQIGLRQLGDCFRIAALFRISPRHRAKRSASPLAPSTAVAESSKPAATIGAIGKGRGS